MSGRTGGGFSMGIRWDARSPHMAGNQTASPNRVIGPEFGAEIQSITWIARAGRSGEESCSDDSVGGAGFGRSGGGYRPGQQRFRAAGFAKTQREAVA